MPVHDTTGVVDALMAGGLAGLDLVTSATSNDGTASYSYDPTGQLIGASYTGGQSDEAYAYDANGNRTSANGSTYVTGVDNRLISDGTYTYSYDPEGHRVARWVDVNADGVLDAGDTDITVYGWDVRNRLTSVTASATFGGDPAQTVQYRYDPEDRLIAETVDSNGDGVVDHQTYFVYDGHEIVLQFDRTSPLPSGEGQGEGITAANLSHRYLWDPVVDQVLADEQLSPLPVGEGQGEGFDLAHAGNVVWPLADNLGTARDLAITDPQTGATTVANHRVFDTYGNLKSQTNAAVDYIFGFTGFLTDKATGLYMSQTRPYDPRVGRWAQPDRIGLFGRDTNPSRYCGNSPTNAIDPSGLAWLFSGGTRWTITWRAPSGKVHTLSGNYDSWFGGSDLGVDLKHIRFFNGTIMTMVIVGHGYKWFGPEGILNALSIDPKVMGIKNDKTGEDLTALMTNITGPVTDIYLYGCHTDLAAKLMSQILNNGAAVTGVRGTAARDPGARWE